MKIRIMDSWIFLGDLTYSFLPLVTLGWHIFWVTGDSKKVEFSKKSSFPLTMIFQQITWILINCGAQYSTKMSETFLKCLCILFFSDYVKTNLEIMPCEIFSKSWWTSVNFHFKVMLPCIKTLSNLAQRISTVLYCILWFPEINSAFQRITLKNISWVRYLLINFNAVQDLVETKYTLAVV